MSTLELKELSAPAGEVIKIAAGKTLDLKSQGSTTLPTGSVLQVVGMKVQDNTTSTSSTYANTGVTLSITPSSTSNKVLITVGAAGCGVHGHTEVHQGLRIVRGSTVLIKFEGQGGYNSNSLPASDGYSCTFLDSPSTASAVTYVLQMANVSNGNGVVRLGHSTSESTMVLQEIQG